MYRVAHLVAYNLLLTSNWELRFSKRSVYCDGTLILMSTNSVPRPDGPRCRVRVLHLALEGGHQRQHLLGGAVLEYVLKREECILCGQHELSLMP